MRWPFSKTQATATYRYVTHADVPGLMFVHEFPDEELHYRIEKVDGLDLTDPTTGKTRSWAELSTDAMLVATIDYVGYAMRIAGWGDGLLDKATRFTETAQKHLYAAAYSKEKFDDVRLQQRVVIGLGRVAAARAPTPTMRAYVDAAPSPSMHLDATNMLEDHVFAYLRVGGLNPVLLRTTADQARVARCADLDVVRGQLDATGDDLAGALAAGRVHVVDPEAFAILRETLVPSHEPEHPHAPRFLTYPSAVFVRPPDQPHLRPVAIRCMEGHATLSPRSPDEHWKRAKFHYNVADCLYHTFVSHLPHTHFVMEGIIIASRNVFGYDRSVSAHPIGRLLQPHLDGTLAINRVARGTVLSGASPFADFVGCDIHSTRELLARALADRRREFAPLPDVHELVADPALVFPFRDDFARLRAVLRRWVADYIDVARRSIGKPLYSDKTVQRWLAEVADPQRGAVSGFPRVDSDEALVEALATIIVIASVQHAAIHFPQTDIGRQAMVSPFYAADVAPGYHADKDRITLLGSLPRLDAAMWQASLFRLSRIRWRCLDTLAGRFADASLEPATTALSAGLAAARATIEARNDALQAAGLPRYEYLLPGNVPCSINA